MKTSTSKLALFLKTFPPTVSDLMLKTLLPKNYSSNKANVYNIFEKDFLLQVMGLNEFTTELRFLKINLLL